MVNKAKEEGSVNSFIYSFIPLFILAFLMCTDGHANQELTQFRESVLEKALDVFATMLMQNSPKDSTVLESGDLIGDGNS